jgi:hypothetical protein
MGLDLLAIALRDLVALGIEQDRPVSRFAAF